MCVSAKKEAKDATRKSKAKVAKQKKPKARAAKAAPKPKTSASLKNAKTDASPKKAKTDASQKKTQASPKKAKTDSDALKIIKQIYKSGPTQEIAPRIEICGKVEKGTGFKRIHICTFTEKKEGDRFEQIAADFVDYIETNACSKVACKEGDKLS